MVEERLAGAWVEEMWVFHIFVSECSWLVMFVLALIVVGTAVVGSVVGGGGAQILSE